MKGVKDNIESLVEYLKLLEKEPNKILELKNTVN